ncbi:MAG: galactose mutarotase [Gemmatimonadota bacterium]|nr:galactose mutarotase [Gemmatimonadota bacterium]
MNSITSAPFGTASDGTDVTLYTLTTATGIEARVMSYGGIIVSLRVPDRAGVLGDVVLGFDSLQPYLTESPYFGALIGRYANRIAGGRFTLDGAVYELPKNDGPNSLHGGTRGFDKFVWNARRFQLGDRVGVTLTRTSPDGEDGYPGDLAATVTYTLTDAGELVFDYSATTDRPTPINLTQHSYFNLANGGAGDILGHVVTINAGSFTPIDATLIPTGEIRGLAGTPLDFSVPTPIGARIGQTDEQLAFAKGYDHNFVLRHNTVHAAANLSGGAASRPKLALAAEVYEPVTGRVMTVHTTEPGMQFYSGNFLDGTIIGKGGVAYGPRSGFAMETQHYPDSPNQPDFPSTILRPGGEYRSRSVYTFSVLAD